MIRIQGLYKKVLTVGFSASLGLIGFIAAGQTTVHANPVSSTSTTNSSTTNLSSLESLFGSLSSGTPVWGSKPATSDSAASSDAATGSNGNGETTPSNTNTNTSAPTVNSSDDNSDAVDPEVLNSDDSDAENVDSQDSYTQNSDSSTDSFSATANSKVATSSKGQQIITFGKKYLGTPYKFGASTSTTKNFDCSSFMKYIFGNYGVTLPRTSVDQSKMGKAVSKANLQVGDLVFFSSGSRATGSNVTHVAVYAGNGQILHTYGSPGVTFSDLNSGNWKKTYLKARRVL